MEQEIKKVAFTFSEWADIVDFLSNNMKHIHSLLKEVMVERDMIESRIVLSHFRTGVPQLSLEIEYPHDQDRLVVALILPPSPCLINEAFIHKEYSFTKIVLFVSNQIILT